VRIKKNVCKVLEKILSLSSKEGAWMLFFVVIDGMFPHDVIFMVHLIAVVLSHRNERW
jgi:hypothetical protein